MAGLTLQDAETALAEALAARTKILQSQEYHIGSRRNKRADLAAVNADIKYWQEQCQKLGNGAGAKVRGLSIG